MKPYADKPLLLQLIHSFRYAFAGCALLLRDRNMLVHALAALVVAGLGFYFRISAFEWLAIVLAITLVIAMEAMNSALEFAVDLASPEFHPVAAKAKDISSASVLMAAIGAIIVGAIVFAPRLIA